MNIIENDSKFGVLLYKAKLKGFSNWSYTSGVMPSK